MTPDQIAEAHRLQDFFFAALGVRFACTMTEVRDALQPVPLPVAAMLSDQAASGEVLPDLPASESQAKPAVEAVDGSAMSEGEAVASSPETAEVGSRLDAGRTASATSETMDVTAGETAPHSEKAADAPPAGEVPVASPAPKLTHADRIRAVLEEHPDYTASQISAVTGIKPMHINSAAKKAGITIRRMTPGEAKAARRAGQAKSVKVRQARKEPDPKPAPERGSDALDTSDEEEPRARVIRPTGKLFWLKDADGKYLGRFCNKMVTDRREAWTGNERQLVGCRKSFLLARDLREVPVEKNMPAARKFS